MTDSYEAYTEPEIVADDEPTPPGAAIDLEPIVGGIITLAGWGLPPDLVNEWRRRSTPGMVTTLEEWRVKEAIASLGLGGMMPGVMPVKYAALIGVGIVGIGIARQRQEMVQALKEAQRAQEAQGVDREGMGNDQRSGAATPGDPAN